MASQQLHLVTSGTCESNGYSPIIGPDWCNIAMHAHLNLDGDPGVDNPEIEKLYGPGDCEIGASGVDYGSCGGTGRGSIKYPIGCSIKDGVYDIDDGKNIASRTSGDANACSMDYQWYASS